MRRRPWVAAVLNIVLTGLGHLYVGEPRRAIAFFAIFVASVVVALLTILYVPFAPFNVFVPFALVLFVWVYAIGDGVACARRAGEFSLKPYNRWWVYLGVFLLVGFVAQPIAAHSFKSEIAEPFRQAAASMEPTLQLGDYLLVNKRAFRSTSPQRFELAVFDVPGRPGSTYVKRVVGIPGDTLQMVRKSLFLNGIPVKEPYVQHTDSLDVTSPAMRWQMPYLADPKGHDAYRPTRDTWGPIVVPAKSYFVLGDNRDESEDSRFFGFVPAANLIGAPERVYFSSQPGGPVRWSRIGQTVR